MVEQLRNMKFTWQQVANVLMVSRSTLWRRFTEMGLPMNYYTDITDSELDGVIEIMVRDFPRNGIVMLWGQLKSMNIIVTRQRVTESLMRVSPQLVQLRRSRAITRRVYNVRLPNFFMAH
jgi:hypothetical protein